MKYENVKKAAEVMSKLENTRNLRGHAKTQGYDGALAVMSNGEPESYVTVDLISFIAIVDVEIKRLEAELSRLGVER